MYFVDMCIHSINFSCLENEFDSFFSLCADMSYKIMEKK